MYLSFPYDQTVIMRRASLELPDKFSLVPFEGRTEAQKDIASERAKRPIVLYDLQRKLETSGQRISFDRPSLAPMAFVRFCIKYPRDCEIRHMAFRPRPVVLSQAQKAELAKVNHAVNRAITPQANGNGVMQEEWLISPREGDCNDYAVTKRHELLVRGWPSRSLLLTEVVIPSGEHHLVLVVRTRDGDLVLDNLNPNIRLVSQVRYQWVRAQQEPNPKFWSTIGLAHAPRVAMNAD
jgi:predicted transglutaminase-like cysteine proteinase